MYRQLLNDLMYYYSTKELKDQFDSSIYLYKRCKPVLFLDNKIFNIEYQVFSMPSSLNKLINNIKNNESCKYSFHDMRTLWYITINEAGFVNSTLPMVFEYDTYSEGICKIIDILYIIEDSGLMLIYKYNHMWTTYTLRFNDKLTNCSHQKTLEIINKSKEGKNNIRQCLCGILQIILQK